MSGYLTHTHRVTAAPLWFNATEEMSKKRSAHMRTESERSRAWFLRLEGWAQLQLWSTNGLPPSSQRNATSLTAEFYFGFAANSASHYCALPLCASEDQGPHTITQLVWLGKPLISPARRAESCPHNREQTFRPTCSHHNHCNLYLLVVLFFIFYTSFIRVLWPLQLHSFVDRSWRGSCMRSPCINTRRRQ